MRFLCLFLLAGFLGDVSHAFCQIPPPPPFFDGGYTDNCSDEYSDFDHGVCQAQSFSEADRALNHSYDQLYQTLPPDQQARLRHDELAWISRRNNDCVVKLNDRILIDFDRAIQMSEARAAELDERREAPLRPKLSDGQYLVIGTAKPWDWDGSRLNTAYEFGDHDGSDPTIVVLSKMNAQAGETLLIKYVSGEANIGPGDAMTDANGLSGTPWSYGSNGPVGTPFPSAFMRPYPILPGVLVGAFTDSTGQLVEPPFVIGDLARRIIPPKATQLQLGVNDNYPQDNAGFFVVSVKVVPAS